MNRDRLTIVARGNHLDGYRGVVVRDWGKPDERDLGECRHAHPTAEAARDCVRWRIEPRRRP